MAFLLPNLSPSFLLQIKSSSSSSKEKFIHHTFSLSKSNPLSPSTSLETPPIKAGHVSESPGNNEEKKQRDDFYLNLGVAVRTLREDLPLLFTEDLNYDIYRDDITLLDPLNTFTGIENYKLIFWALRFHGKVLFKEISLEIFRVWQPSENTILIRWNLKGVPRVPWEAKGQFQGTSRYKLDRNGKIYEHKVDNLAFNFPQKFKPVVSVLDLVRACPPSPNPTFMWDIQGDPYTSTWVEFYRSVWETLEEEGRVVRLKLDEEDYLLAQEGMVTCS